MGHLFYVVVLCGALLVGVGWGWVGQSATFLSVFTQEVRRVPPKDIFQRQEVTLLVLGCDEDRDWRTQAITKRFARSDMMLVLKIDFEKKLVSGLSIPRDTEVTVAGHTAHKINAYHDMGGKDLAQKAAEAVMGITIDRTVVLDYEAFKRMVDLVGGVEVYVDKPLNYDDNAGDLHVHLDVGRHMLDGEGAMGYVRIRKVDSDFVRQKRQKDFMMSFKDRVKGDIWKTPALFNEVLNLFGGEFTPEEMAALARFGQTITADNFKMGMVPITERRGTTNLYVDYDKLGEMLVEYHFVEQDSSAVTLTP